MATPQVSASYSQLKELSQCEFRWLLNHGLGLKPIKERAPIYFGGVTHDLVERLYRTQQATDAVAIETVISFICHGPAGLTSDQLKDVAEFFKVDKIAGVCSVLNLPFNAQENRFMGVIEEKDLLLKSLIDRGAVTDMTHEDRAELMTFAENVFFNYWAQWAELDVQRFKILSVEGWFKGPILTPTGRIARGKEYRGRRDAIVRDLQDGQIKILEHKTTSDRKHQTTMGKYRMDIQGIPYVLFGGDLWRDHERPKEVIYNIIRSQLPSVPEFVGCTDAHKDIQGVCPRCGTKDGKNPEDPKQKARAVSLKPIDTTADIFRDAVESLSVTVEGHEGYKAIHEKLLDNWYFYRESVFIEDRHVETFQLRTYREMSHLGQLITELDKFRSIHGGQLALEALAKNVDPHLLSIFPQRAPQLCHSMGKCSYLPMCSQEPGAEQLFSVKGRGPIQDLLAEEGWDSDFEV